MATDYIRQSIRSIRIIRSRESCSGTSRPCWAIRGLSVARVDELVQPYAGMGISKIAGIEARGFILGGAMAHQLSCGFVPIRKKGKLPQ